MGIIEITLIGFGLAMDAFAVAICKGLTMKKMEWKKAFIIGTYFGLFQAFMPAIGYFLGIGFEDKIKNIDHWIAFILLGFIGINMIKDSLSDGNKNVDEKIDFNTMIILSIATSIDALAAGLTFSLFEINIFLAISIIGIITFIISSAGVKVGNLFGNKYEAKAEITGGSVLILIGLKILLEHLGILVL